MKKIICTVSNDLSQDQRMHRICSTLGEQGHEVLLIGRKKKTSIPFGSTGNYKYKRLSLFFESGVLFYMELNIRLFFYLLFSSFDIVNSIDTDTLMAGRIAARLKKKEFVFDSHELFDKVPELSNSKFKQKIWNKIEYHFLRNSKYNYTVNNSLKRILEKRHDIPFSVIYNFPEYYEIASEDRVEFGEPFKLIYQGMLNEGRGLTELVESLVYIQGIHLTLIGIGALELKLKALVNSLDIKRKVSFLGFINGKELRKITPKFDLGINLLSNISESYWYSSANKFFDYTMAEIPSINMRFPEYDAFNNQHEVALLIEDLETSSIKNAILAVQEDKSYYNKLKANCKLAKQSWNWRNESNKLDGFYANILIPKA